MKLNYGSSVPISTIDWHGHVSVVFFLRGCPFRCPYCQNYELLVESNMTDVSVLEAAVKKSRPFVSSMVLSGGEPLIQKKASMHLARFAKSNGLLVGVHTCGFYPKVVAEMIDESLVDKFFVDVKAPLDNFGMYTKAIGFCEPQEACDCIRVNPEEVVKKVSESILTVIQSDVDLELRTTAIRDFIGNADDISKIAASILKLTGRKDIPYVIQQGIPEHAMLESMRDTLPYNRDEMLELASVAHEFLDNVWIRTKEKGNEKV
ncbi:anaerobic ribonucleoside-triphosphate reductase activating protein [Methanolobus sp. ZRKC2]|uniref:anaerobic ribonucleoside-triphosphate reductase activating protein n=1 Tax=Methanolobus sp. ZRKC2 TaxID=3125783 RepID=UPI003247195C